MDGVTWSCLQFIRGEPSPNLSLFCSRHACACMILLWLCSLISLSTCNLAGTHSAARLLPGQGQRQRHPQRQVPKLMGAQISPLGRLQHSHVAPNYASQMGPQSGNAWHCYNISGVRYSKQQNSRPASMGLDVAQTAQKLLYKGVQTTGTNESESLLVTISQSPNSTGMSAQALTRLLQTRSVTIAQHPTLHQCKAMHWPSKCSDTGCGWMGGWVWLHRHHSGRACSLTMVQDDGLVQQIYPDVP